MTWRNTVIFVLLSVVGSVLDLWTKNWIFAELGLSSRDAIVLWPNVFELTTNLNEGALFGMGQGYALFFAGMAIIATLVILFWLFLRQGFQDFWLVIALGLVCGGIVGNFYDRLGWHGIMRPGVDGPEPMNAVRDWLHFCLKDGQGKVLFDWPVFNLADCYLVVGAGIMFLLIIS